MVAEYDASAAVSLFWASVIQTVWLHSFIELNRKQILNLSIFFSHLVGKEECLGMNSSPEGISAIWNLSFIFVWIPKGICLDLWRMWDFLCCFLFYIAEFNIKNRVSFWANLWHWIFVHSCFSFFSPGRTKTRCEVHRDNLLGVTEFGPRGPRPPVGQYIPTCDENGEYEPVQCHDSTGNCWCVDRYGQEIDGTRSGPGSRPVCE